MNDRTNVDTEQGLQSDLLATVEEMLARGQRPLIVDGKRPVGGAGWHAQQLSPEQAQVQLASAHEPGVGLLLGPAGGVIDIESDSEAEEQLFDQLFAGQDIPPTPSYSSRRGVHRLFAWDDRLAEIGKAVLYWSNGAATSGETPKLGVRIGANGHAAQSVIPPSPGRQWLRGLAWGDVELAPLPEAVIERLLSYAPQHVAASRSGVPQPHGDACAAALAAMLNCRQSDSGDGSRRLLTYACRAVEHDLDDAAAMAAIRAAAAPRPFPSNWSDADIIKRLRDAEGMTTRGKVYAQKRNARNLQPEMEAARILDSYQLGGMSRLRFWQSQWWWWIDGRYVARSAEEVRGEVAKHISNNWSDVKSRYVSDVMEHVRAKAMLPSAIEQPAWLGDAPHGWAAEDCLATRDAIVHLPSLAAQREPAIIAASPSLWTTTATEFAIDLQAPRPESWLRFLDDLWGNDAESIQLLQEWFGYCLTSDTRQHKMLLVVGPPRSGKGTVGRVLTALVGKGNVAAPTLGGLSTNFGLWPLIDKGLAIISDARLSRRADQDPVVERLLSITGEDSITVDRKNLAPLTLRLPTRFMIMSNELPRLSDASAAVVSRFLVLRTATSWLGREDHELESRLLAELPGILSWAIEGWRRLRERGHFCQPASGAEAVETMNDLASPVGAFVRECCSVEVGLRVAKQVLFEAWQQWCGQHGRGMSAGSLETFSRDLFAAAPGVRSARHRVGGRRINFFSNITLRTSSR